jgi:subtilisin family serine protease
VSDASRLLRGTLPCLVAFAVATGFVLPANARQLAGGGQTVPAVDVTRGAEWWLTALRVSGGWRAAPAEGKGVTVAVLSTGVDAASPDLTGAVTIGPDYSGSGRTSAGPFWGDEGTAVASLIAGHGHGTGATDGITGVAPHARILAIQVTLEYNDPLNADSSITKGLTNAIASGIRYAVGHGAGVIALPLDPATLGPVATGDPAIAGGSPSERAAVGYALAHNVVLIAPAGDNGAGTGSVNYPAAYPGVVAVGATGRGGQLAPFTSKLSYVALTAPGSGLTVANPSGGYQTLATTDLSAALTAGVAALIRSRFPLLTAADVTRALAAGARPASGPKAAGRGRGALDATGALAAAATLAAARQPQPRTAAPTTAPPPAPATQPAATRAVSRPAGASTLAGTLVRDLVIGSGVLIVALAGALALVVKRRRTRFARQGPPRSGQGGSHARRPRPVPGQPQATGQSRTSAWRQQPVALDAGRQPRALGPGTSPGAPRVVPVQATGILSMPGHGRRKKKTSDKPPWEPASPPQAPQIPQAPLAMPRALPSLPASGAHLGTGGSPGTGGPPITGPPVAGRHPATGPPVAGRHPVTGQPASLAPWERSPDEFAAAPVPADIPEWPASNTGPMYLWNPNASTSPQPAIPPDDEPAHPDSGPLAPG